MADEGVRLANHHILGHTHKKKYKRIMRALRKGENVPQPASQIASTAFETLTDPATALQPTKTLNLSNLDIQLINCLINLSVQDKIELLIRLND